jgi:hypothetical protein
MPASRSPAASTFLEKPGRREFGTARTSASSSTPAAFSALTSCAWVAPS